MQFFSLLDFKINNEHFWNLSGILGFYTAGQLKKLADNENKKNFEVQPSKLPWIWSFGANVRTMEGNYSLGRHSEPPAGFAEREKKLYLRLDCCSEWLLSLYL